MATIGQELLEAENGWTRYDLSLDTPNIKFPIGATYITNSYYYGAGAIRINVNEKIKFYIKGTSIRILSVLASSQSENIEIEIDDNLTETFSCNSSSTVFKALIYEKSGLEYGVHKVTITNLSSTSRFIIDAVDLIGELITDKRRLLIKNITTSQHYSLAEKTLIQLPSTSSKNISLYGIESFTDIRLDEAFDKISKHNNTPNDLVGGRYFTHELDLNLIKIKKINLK